MTNYAALMSLGKGLTAAGQTFDRNFQLQMEQMRQRSLEQLEKRRLDIMEKEAVSNEAYRTGTLAATKADQFTTAKEKLQARMDKQAEQIVANLPDAASRDMTARLLSEVMGSPELMMQFYDTKTDKLDAELLGQTISDLASSMQVPGVLDDAAAQAAITRFAGSMVKEWGSLNKRFPEFAESWSVTDIIDSIPAFYSAVGRESGQLFAPGQDSGGVTPSAVPAAAAPPALAEERRTVPGMGLSQGLMSLGGGIKDAAIATGDLLRGYPVMNTPTLTPNQQRAQALGFTNAQGQPTGIRQSVPGAGLMAPAQYGPRLPGPLDLSRDPQADLDALLQR
jgi:hypothetical protein